MAALAADLGVRRTPVEVTMKDALSGIVLSLLIATEALPMQPPVNRVSSDEAAVRQVMDDLAVAWNRHDIDSYAGLFTEDVDFTNWRGTLRVHGRADLRNSHAPLFAGMFRQSHVAVRDIRVRFFTPTLAAVHCVWEVTGIIDYDGKGIIPPRTYLPLFVVTHDRETWLVAVMHNVLVQPLPPGAEERIKGPVKN
jgi:uncharacterized protein (TIGR02246 family)